VALSVTMTFLCGLLPPYLVAFAAADSPELVAVHFVTNRGLENDADGNPFFGSNRGGVSQGTCEVQFKPLEVMSDLAESLPFYLPSESKTMTAVTPVDELDFWSDLTASARADGDQVLVYIHGYNFSFERVCLRAAELQRLLGAGVRVVAFTWPSAANIVRYSQDETNVFWSLPAIREFLCELVTRYGGENVHLAGHSMGARAAVYSLFGWSCDAGAEPRLGELVLAAPDIDAEVFRSRIDELTPLVDRITVYASDDDTLLGTSRTLHGYPRLGEAGDDLVIVDGVDMIDATVVGLFDFSGHNYYYFHPWVMSDIRDLLVYRRPAICRAHLQPEERAGQTYWRLAGDESEDDEKARRKARCEMAGVDTQRGTLTDWPV